MSEPIPIPIAVPGRDARPSAPQSQPKRKRETPAPSKRPSRPVPPSQTLVKPFKKIKTAAAPVASTSARPVVPNNSESSSDEEPDKENTSSGLASLLKADDPPQTDQSTSSPEKKKRKKKGKKKQKSTEDAPPPAPPTTETQSVLAANEKSSTNRKQAWRESRALHAQADRGLASAENAPIPAESAHSSKGQGPTSLRTDIPSLAPPTIKAPVVEPPVPVAPVSTTLDVRAEMRERAQRFKLMEDQQRKEREAQERISVLEQQLVEKDLELAGKRDSIKTVKQALTCGICLQLMHRPFLISPCGHAACFQCLKDWFLIPSNADLAPSAYSDGPRRKNQTCPQCRTPVTAPPTPIYLLKALIATLGNVLLEPGEEPPLTVVGHEIEGDVWGGLFDGADAGVGFELPIWDGDDACWRCRGCTNEVLDGVCTSCARQYLNPEGVDQARDEDEVGSVDSLDMPEVQQRARRQPGSDHSGSDHFGSEEDLDAYETDMDSVDENALDPYEQEIDQKLEEKGATPQMIDRFRLTIDGNRISALIPDSRNLGESHEIRIKVRRIELEEDDEDGARFIRRYLRNHSKERKWWRKERLAREQNRTIQRRARASGDQDEEMDGFDRPLSDDSDDSSLDGDRSEDEDEDSGSSDGEGSEEGIGRFVDEEAVSSDDEEGDSSDRGFLDDEDEEPVPRKPRLRSAASRAETEDEDDEVLVMSEDETNRSPVRIGRKLKKRVVVSDAEEEEEEE